MMRGHEGPPLFKDSRRKRNPKPGEEGQTQTQKQDAPTQRPVGIVYCGSGTNLDHSIMSDQKREPTHKPSTMSRALPRGGQSVPHEIDASFLQHVQTRQSVIPDRSLREVSKGKAEPLKTNPPPPFKLVGGNHHMSCLVRPSRPAALCGVLKEC